jgi:aspartate racemase
MKKIGIVGGIGPASTLDYYKGIIDGCFDRSGSKAYPRIVIDSIDMMEMLGYVTENDRRMLTTQLRASIRNLESSGAEVAAIASNTPHIVFDAVQVASPLPLISIVEETCRTAASCGYVRVAVLGTLFTMRNGLYTDAFTRYGIQAFVPDEKTQEAVHGVIFPNLENGIVLPEEKARLLRIAQELIDSTKAEALVLGCTELPLAIHPGDLAAPILDTAQIHIKAIINAAMTA